VLGTGCRARTISARLWATATTADRGEEPALDSVTPNDFQATVPQRSLIIGLAPTDRSFNWISVW